MSKTSLVSKFERVKAIRSRQVYCPVAKLRAMVTPLTVNDDLSLKTMISSPDLYDKNVAILVYNHSEFPDINGAKPSFEQFIESISDFDRKSLLWGIYDATYSTLGKNQITCPKCKHKAEVEILAKDLLHPDSIKSQWDREESFLDYSIPVDINMGLDDFQKVTFNVSIPSIKKHLDVLKLISVDDMKDNFNKFNSIVSKPEELCLITKSISVYGEDLETPDETVTSTYEIHTIIQEYITLDIINDVMDSFDNEFSKYNPTFKKNLTCGDCGHNFDLPIDIEVALFRSYLRL
jgi:hypothetical protein